MGGGGLNVPPIFLFVKTIEKVIRLCTVLKKKSLISSFKDKANFHVILEIDSFEQKNREKCPLSSQPPLKKKNQHSA